MENDWLKKKGGVNVESRLGWIDGAEEIPLSRQCELAEVRSAARDGLSKTYCHDAAGCECGRCAVVPPDR